MLPPREGIILQTGLTLGETQQLALICSRILLGDVAQPFLGQVPTD